MPSSRLERRTTLRLCLLSSCSNSFLIKLLARVDDLKNDFHTPTPSFPIECSLPAKDKLLRVKVAPDGSVADILNDLESSLTSFSVPLASILSGSCLRLFATKCAALLNAFLTVFSAAATLFCNPFNLAINSSGLNSESFGGKFETVAVALEAF